MSHLEPCLKPREQDRNEQVDLSNQEASYAWSLWWSLAEPVWREHWLRPCCRRALETEACLRWWDSSRSVMSCRSGLPWLAAIRQLIKENTQGFVGREEGRFILEWQWFLINTGETIQAILMCYDIMCIINIIHVFKLAKICRLINVKTSTW